MSELIFYTNPMSRGRTVRWMLEEIGQPYQTEILDYATTLKSPEYRAINPMAKVPALRHGPTIVTEVAAICTYLADAFPEANLAPEPADRGAYYRWLFFTAGPLEAAMINKALDVTVPPGKERMAGYGTYALVMDTLETVLTNTIHIAADHFTAADLILASFLAFSMQFNMLEKRPAFETYAARHITRPAAIRAREIDDALLATQPQ